MMPKTRDDLITEIRNRMSVVSADIQYWKDRCRQELTAKRTWIHAYNNMREDRDALMECLSHIEKEFPEIRTFTNDFLPVR